jgi:glutaconate CoA-transferase, subunit A
VTELLTPDEAASWVAPGSTLGIGGLQGNFPMATLRAIARGGPGGLHLVGPAAGMAPEMLIAAGCAASIRATHMGCDPVIAIAPAYRAAVESGDLEVRECDEGTLLISLRAAGQRLPYLPWRGGVGTDLARLNPEYVEYVDPPSGITLMRIPALPVDVALLRAYEADEYGNVRYRGHSHFSDPAFAKAAGRVIVEVERIADHGSFVAEPLRTVHHRVDAIVVAPLGGHPFRAAGSIGQDDEWLREWSAGIKAAITAGEPVATADVVRRELGLADEAAYLDLVGADRLATLRAEGCTGVDSKTAKWLVG